MYADRQPDSKSPRIRRMNPLAPALTVLLVCAGVASPQIRYSSGQNVVPVFEGWERNADGSVNMVFGYMNRNYEEEVDIPIGVDNKIEPGEADRNQPAHFYPRRQEFVFKVKVPKDWGDKNLVWTLTSRGKTEKAFGSLMPIWELSNLVYQENRRGAASLVFPEEPNSPPSIEMSGSLRRTATVGEPVTLTVQVADDGNPKPVHRPSNRAGSRAGATRSIRSQSPASQAVVKLDPGVRLGVTWVVYRGGPGKVTLDPMRVPVALAASSAGDRLAGQATTTVSFSKAGQYLLRAYADDGVLVTPLDVTVAVHDPEH